MKAKTEKDLKLPRYFASVIVMNKKGKVLLGIRKEDGIATPPGGHAEDHETPTQAAVRELFEETAIIAEEQDLEELPTIDTVHGKICHCYMFVTKQDATPALDPDKEVYKWEWYDKDELPKALEKDPRRFQSVRNAFMKFHGIAKGGPGSGQKGHQTFKPHAESHVAGLADKLSDPAPFKAHLTKLQNSAVFEGAKLKSGKPLYLDMSQALSHGYSPQDFSEASNFHWEKMQSMNNQIQKVKHLGKEPPKEMKEIMKFHERQFKQNHAMVDSISRRHAKAGEAVDRAKDGTSSMAKLTSKLMTKSVVMMGHNDAAEIDTGKFAQEHHTDLSSWEQLFSNWMSGYNYGDTPREIPIDKGTLYLTKVDDGMYSGYVRLLNDQMEDNAKVRIERMAIPSLTQFLLAKEYILPSPSIAGSSPGNNSMATGGEMTMASPSPQQYENLNDSLMLEPLSEPKQPEMIQFNPSKVESVLDKKIMILQLIDKLMS